MKADKPSSTHWLQALATVAEAFDPDVFAQLGDKVLSGPFKDMIIPKTNIWADGNNSSKLFGTYEHELHPVIEKAISRKPDLVINHGCAEGYYAIGFALRLPHAKIFAVDIKHDCLVVCCEFAKRNGLPFERITYFEGHLILGDVIPSTGHRLYVVDIEGAETIVLDLEKVPELQNSDIIVECHDFNNMITSDTLITRFIDTHVIQVIHPSVPSIPVELERLPVIIRMLLAIDKRPGNNFWLALWAKSYKENPDAAPDQDPHSLANLAFLSRTPLAACPPPGSVGGP